MENCSEHSACNFTIRGTLHRIAFLRNSATDCFCLVPNDCLWDNLISHNTKFSQLVLQYRKFLVKVLVSTTRIFDHF